MPERSFDRTLNSMSAADRLADESAVSPWRDRLGICLSTLCLAHCLLTPFVVGLLPMGTAFGFWHHGFHEVFLAVVPLVALIAFVPGWRIHRDRRVWYWGLSGIALLALGVAFHPLLDNAGLGTGSAWLAAWIEPLVRFNVSLESGLSMGVEFIPTILGGICLVRAHLLNRELCACCAHNHNH